MNVFRTTIFALVLTGCVTACTHVPTTNNAVDFSQSYVGDEAHLLNPDQHAELVELLSEHRRNAQIELRILPELPQNTSIEAYASAKLHETEPLRESAHILFVVAMKDKSMRIETNKAAEVKVPDDFCQDVIDNIMIPRFKQDQYFLGIHDGISAVIAALSQ